MNLVLKLERGKIAVRLDFGVELKRSNEFLIMVKTCGAWILRLLCIGGSRKMKSCFSGRSSRKRQKAAASSATRGNVASDDMP